MSTSGSVSRWINLMKAGDTAAAQPLWERYFRRLVGLARKKLVDAPRRAADEEDVALSAFASFCRRAEEGRFPQLDDRDDLWRILFTITVRKAFNVTRDEQRAKRGGGAVRGESALVSGDPDAAERGLEQIVGDEPTPEYAAQVAEGCRRLLDRLGDGELRNIAVWKMEGHTNEEITEKLGCAVRTVERKLLVIRGLWEKDPEP